MCRLENHILLRRSGEMQIYQCSKRIIGGLRENYLQVCGWFPDHNWIVTADFKQRGTMRMKINIENAQTSYEDYCEMKRDEVRHSLPCISNLSHIHREKKNILKKYYLSINCGSFIEGGDWRTRVKCQETLPDFGASLVSSETWEHCFYIIAGVFFIMLLHRINHSLERLKYQRQTGYKGTCRIVFFFFQRRTSREEDDTLTKISC